MTGKSILDDLREGKPTVMMALARGSADRDQARRLKELFGNPDLDPDGRGGAARSIIVDTGALDRIEQMIKVRTDAALGRPRRRAGFGGGASGARPRSRRRRSTARL